MISALRAVELRSGTVTKRYRHNERWKRETAHFSTRAAADTLNGDGER
jgi:hypothetical protein